MEHNDNMTANDDMSDHELQNITETLSQIEAEEQSKIGQLEQKVAEVKDLYLRSQAEVANIQRRSQEEIKKARDFSISSFAKDLIVVQDYLEMALKDQSANIDTIKMGVDLTLKQLVQVFERHYIKSIAPQLKDKLDPNLHHAVSTVETDEQEANTVVEILQKGYMLNDRVLRPAMVVVAKAVGKTE